MLQPRIEVIAEKKLIGKRLPMSFANNRTGELWKSFMPRRHEIHQAIGADLYSMQQYAPGFFTDFNPAAEFEKWAGLEVTDFATVPPDMEAVLIPGGQYAVFFYRGLNTDTSIFQYIFTTWLPASDYVLDDRPHFEILGPKYRNNDPASEEEIWIPVSRKA
ncbi:GyrI-like domain-containing protein [Hymenobacter sp. DG25A]|uniref:GyrI-like domain-containing protein n=1 Tax=Hymenobacter sp. DG25A TaxID=1385663 RepID=UPI0006BDE72B|nr:GyrI-like domain-containing protein [Hymenobacter sp. DG25A]ALD20922.1 AraC family transcriptional regulator [Hymenobacter sp. DG25A]